MQKTIEERLADIESSLTRLTKMQGCVFGALLILHKTSALFGRSERALTSVEESLEPIHRGMDRYLIFMFGGITMLGVAISMTSLYLVTLDFVFKVLSIVFSILTLVSFFFGFWEYSQVRRQHQEAKRKLTQAGEVLVGVEKEVAATDNDLAQVLAEWKELALDELVNKSGNDTPGPKDSHDRS